MQTFPASMATRSEGLVAVLLCDLIGSTALRVEIGEASANTLGLLTQKRIRESVAAHGGEVVVGTGDGVAAVFHSISRAFGAALALSDDLRSIDHEHAHRQALRVVVDIGDAQWGDGSMRGAVFERASSLIEQIDAEVVCSATARRLALHVNHIAFEPGPNASSFRCIPSGNGQF